ncbi:PucR family transcriptional regulator [Salisediminibacterium halotolerans]|uniref:Sugar diacid utilization regulator n=1 Tax=Salisediminibacterium halotolerans TaxID=517425 RepID=A0A1H9QJ69_9BACI|nr:helix-turn-helix domain-containing protein [Salisediminibacterium haloalkalitolerans]SER60611.1 Sugar diacid utilization regulator [Salisediminibacterium haloalkalitolerans]
MIELELMECLSENGGYRGVLQLFSRHVGTRMVLTDEIGLTLASADNGRDMGSPQLTGVIDLGDHAEVTEERGAYCWMGDKYALTRAGRTVGALYIDALTDTPPSETDLERFTLAVLTEKQKQQLIDQERSRHLDAFLFDLLYGNVKDSADAIAQGELWNLQLTSRYTIVALNIEGGSIDTADEENIDRLYRQFSADLTKHREQPLLLRKGAEIIWFKREEYPAVNEANADEAIRRTGERLLAKADRLFPDKKVLIGAGRPRENCTELFRSYQEAKMARELGDTSPSGRIIFYKDVGVLKLMNNLDVRELTEFYQDVFKPLFEAEEQTKEVLQTLKTYIDCDLDIRTTAETMYLHPNSVRYRINRTEELLGRNLGKFSNLKDIALAFDIASLYKMKGRL